jgi:hypothetical protein
VSHTRCLAFENGESIPLAGEETQAYRYYGQSIADVWKPLGLLSVRCGFGSLDRFVCPQSTYLKVGDLRELREAAEAGGNAARAAKLAAKIQSLLPAHDPNEILAVIQPLIAHLESSSDPEVVELGEIVLFDLKAYEHALKVAAGEQRRVFIRPW